MNDVPNCHNYWLFFVIIWMLPTWLLIPFSMLDQSILDWIFILSAKWVLAGLQICYISKLKKTKALTSKRFHELWFIVCVLPHTAGLVGDIIEQTLHYVFGVSFISIYWQANTFGKNVYLTQGWTLMHVKEQYRSQNFINDVLKCIKKIWQI